MRKSWFTEERIVKILREEDKVPLAEVAKNGADRPEARAAERRRRGRFLAETPETLADARLLRSRSARSRSGALARSLPATRLRPSLRSAR